MSGLFSLFPALMLAVASTALPQTDAGSNSTAQKSSTVEGQVVDAQTGEALRKTTVSLRSRSQPKNYSIQTEADGKFHIDGVQPGEYSLSGEKPGYVGGTYGARGMMSMGTALHLTAGQSLSGLTLKLTRQGVIAGKVLDADGDPVQGAMVSALMKTWMQGKLRYMPRGGQSTNDLGEFRMANLQPGAYYVFAAPQGRGMMGGPDVEDETAKTKPKPVRTFYPDALDLRGAQAVQVSAGQEQSGLDIHLRSEKVHKVSGKVTGLVVSDGPSQPMERTFISLEHANDTQEMEMPFNGMSAVVTKDGSFTVQNVTPGSYNLHVRRFGGKGMGDYGSMRVDVGDQDVVNVTVPVTQPFSISGRVVLEAGDQSSDITQFRLALMQEGGQIFGNLTTMPTKEGSFKFQEVPAGKYRLRAMGLPDGWYLKSARFGEVDPSKIAADMRGNAENVEVVFSKRSANLTGTVKGPQTAQQPAADGQQATQQPQTAPAYAIVLVPEATPDEPRFTNTDQNGQFTIKSLAPGKYVAFAMNQADFEFGMFQNAELIAQLKDKGTEIELHEDDQRQAQVDAISIEDVNRVMQGLGVE